MDDLLLVPLPHHQTSLLHTVNLGSHPAKEMAPRWNGGKDVGESASSYHHQWEHTSQSQCGRAQFCLICTGIGHVGVFIHIQIIQFVIVFLSLTCELKYLINVSGSVPCRPMRLSLHIQKTHICRYPCLWSWLSLSIGDVLLLIILLLLVTHFLSQFHGALRGSEGDSAFGLHFLGLAML